MKTYLLIYNISDYLDWFNYTDFYTMIKVTYAGNYYHLVDGTWIIRTEESPTEIIGRLAPLMNFRRPEGYPSDRAFVTKDQIFAFELSDDFNYDGYGSKGAHDFIRSIKQK